VELDKDYIEFYAFSIANDEIKGIIWVYNLDLESRSLSVGRNNSCGLTFKDISVSWVHALIFVH